MATLTMRFLKDGSVKLEVEGSVDAEIHDAVEADLDELTAMLGGNATREAREEHGHVHHHGYRHAFVKR